MSGGLINVNNIFLLTLSLICIAFTSGFSTIHEVKDLALFEQEATQLDSNSLVLFDIDYTILTPKDAALKPCGRALRKKYLSGLEKVRRERLLSITALEGEEELVDCEFPSLIKSMQSKNILVLGLTAIESGSFGKISYLENWRLSQLKKFGIEFSFVNHKNCISLEDGFSGALFKDGVIFTNQHRKGEVLALFLERAQIKPKKILFIDDSLEQIKGVEIVTEGMGAEFMGFHYKAKSLNSCEFDEKLGEFQFQHLIDNEVWLSDEKAKRLLLCK